MAAFVKKACQEVNLALQDEIPEQCHRPVRRIGHDTVPAIRKPFELHEARRQGGSDVGLAFDRVHRIVFTPDHQGRTPDPVKLREHVERVTLAARFGEPVQGHLRTVDRTARHIRVARNARIDRQREPPPRITRLLVQRGLGLLKPAACQRADFRAAEALEQHHAALPIGTAGGFGVLINTSFEGWAGWRVA